MNTNIYDVWVRPHMPSLEERIPGIIYLPKTYTKDKRLTYLDREVYIALYIYAQLKPDVNCDVDRLLSEIKTHPDKDDEILNNYLKENGKTFDELTDTEFDAIPTIPLTKEDIENSLKRLEEFGYIKKKVPT